MVLDEVEALALDGFLVDPGPYLGIEVLDCDDRSASKAGLQRHDAEVSLFDLAWPGASIESVWMAGCICPGVG